MKTLSNSSNYCVDYKNMEDVNYFKGYNDVLD